MNNYMVTTTPGAKRRRAKMIEINYPAQPLTPPEPVLTYDPLNPDAEPTMQVPEPPMASVTFVMEDRIIMEDGSDEFIPAGNLVVNLDAETMMKRYKHVDIKTGEIDETAYRTGAQIMQYIVDALEDVFVNEGMARDAAVL